LLLLLMAFDGRAWCKGGFLPGRDNLFLGEGETGLIAGRWFG